jgi:diaminohydroxyphosphoribosylaminopyrimidine deaminase/5-amino-6-(5-phosphoribosylamino)uracil reductase
MKAASDSGSAKRYLDMAARAALRAFGRTGTNPMVGAVLVGEAGLLSIGHHRRFGGPHAEVEAIARCRERGLDPRGATMYVTLEPCCHRGKQPPCVDALLGAGIARVVIANADVNPVAAGGAAKLAAGGVEVEFSGESVLARLVTEPFLKRVTGAGPWVIAKWAQTIDGRIATRSGESRWISGDGSRARVHRLRSCVDAILTGIGTVAADDPMLNARGRRQPRRVAIRVVADTDLDLPFESALVRTAAEIPTVVLCDGELLGSAIIRTRQERLERAGVRLLGVPSRAIGIDLRAGLLRLAAEMDVSTVLVEAGPGLVGSMLEDDLIDQAVVYLAPMLLGDELAKSAAAGRVAQHLSMARRFDLGRVRRVGDDLEITYLRARSSVRR